MNKPKVDPFTATNHHELELKWEVTRYKDVSVATLELALRQDCHFNELNVLRVGCPDTYYRQGKQVVRFRAHPKQGELTVKLRTSKKSITNRVEVDIPLAASVTEADVEAFLAATGWKPEVKLYKQSTVFYLGNVIIAHYTVTTDPREKTGLRSFIEVELDKKQMEGFDGAEENLQSWATWMANAFPSFPRKPVSQSLYEMYSGKQYQLAKEKHR